MVRNASLGTFCLLACLLAAVYLHRHALKWDTLDAVTSQSMIPEVDIMHIDDYFIIDSEVNV